MIVAQCKQGLDIKKVSAHHFLIHKNHLNSILTRCTVGCLHITTMEECLSKCNAYGNAQN